MISRELAYVTLVVDDVEGIASLLERQFELTRCEAAVDDGSRMLPVLAVGQSAIVLCEPGDAFVDGYHRTGVHHIALAVENVEAASHHAMNAGVDLAAPESVEGVNGGRRVLLSPGHTGGIRTYLCDSLSISRGTSGLVERIDHLGVASDDCDGTLEAFVTRLGLVWEDTETDIETTVAVETFVSKKIRRHADYPPASDGCRGAGGFHHGGGLRVGGNSGNRSGACWTGTARHGRNHLAR